MGEYVTKEAHEEFEKRMESEHRRASKRLENLENDFKELNELTASVKELAVNMTYMLNEQKRTTERLDTLEGRDGEKWRTVITHIITVAVGLVVGWAFTHLGF